MTNLEQLQYIKQQMFKPNHKTVGRHSLHIAIQLNFITNIQAGLAVFVC